MAAPRLTKGQERGEKPIQRGPKTAWIGLDRALRLLEHAGQALDAWEQGRAPWLPTRDACWAAFILYTGLRRDEACNARCGHYQPRHEEGPRWYVPSGKGNIEGRVPLTVQARAFLERLLVAKESAGESTSSDAPLFCAYQAGRRAAPDRAFFGRSAARDVWRSALTAARVPLSLSGKSVSLQSGRVAAGMLVYLGSRDIQAASWFLRHSDVHVTKGWYIRCDVAIMAEELSRSNVWARAVLRRT